MLFMICLTRVVCTLLAVISTRLIRVAKVQPGGSKPLEAEITDSPSTILVSCLVFSSRPLLKTEIFDSKDSRLFQRTFL